MNSALYCRVSTADQTTANQKLELEQVADRNGWAITQTFTDVISGARAKRPGLDALMLTVARKEVDMVMVWDVSRLGRSLSHLVSLLEEFHAKGVNPYFHQQGIDTTTPAGKAMFQMMGVFAEFERSMISERVRSGLDRARAQGKKLGRPAVPPITVRKVLQLREDGLSFRKVAEQVGIHHRTVQRLCA